jgi:hypothetical protein
MTIQLIRLYLLVCELHDKRQATCFQRTSNNADAAGITDQELITIYWFGHCHQLFEKKAIHRLIDWYWRDFFPKLPAYQTFVARLNQLTATFQSLGAELQERLREQHDPAVDHLLDSLPVMLARGGHAYTATVARDIADVGYCASKKQYFHGLRLHALAQQRRGQLPLPQYLWLREASCHDLRSLLEQSPEPDWATLFGDKAYVSASLQTDLRQQGRALLTPCKRAKGQRLTATEKQYNRCISRLRQPIESLFHWCQRKTDLQTASTVRSTEGLLVHCFGKLAFAYLLLVFNP